MTCGTILLLAGQHTVFVLLIWRFRAQQQNVETYVFLILTIYLFMFLAAIMTACLIASYITQPVKHTHSSCHALLVQLDSLSSTQLIICLFTEQRLNSRLVTFKSFTLETESVWLYHFFSGRFQLLQGLVTLNWTQTSGNSVSWSNSKVKLSKGNIWGWKNQLKPEDNKNKTKANKKPQNLQLLYWPLEAGSQTKRQSVA